MGSIDAFALLRDVTRKIRPDVVKLEGDSLVIGYCNQLSCHH